MKKPIRSPDTRQGAQIGVRPHCRLDRKIEIDDSWETEAW